MKFIIENNTELSDLETLDLIKKVVGMGKISETSKGKQYCFLAVIEYDFKKYRITATKNNKSDKFRIEYKN